jgi:hypothetical protein
MQVMGDSKNLAKVGVFVLLGINIAAYYFFWPKQSGGGNETKAAKADRGDAILMPAQGFKPPEPPKPKELPSNLREGAMPLQITEPLKKSDGPTDPDDDVIRKLLEHIKRDGSPLATPPSKWGDDKKDEKPANPASVAAPIDPSKIAVTSPLTPKLPSSPWFLYQEPAGKQTVLIGKLHATPTAPPVAEFRILCDRVETKSAVNEVVAIGNVAFSGAGLKGQCGKLTLPLLEPMLIFDEAVRIEHESGLAPLRGERIFWGPMVMPTPSPVGVRPLVGPPQ